MPVRDGCFRAQLTDKRTYGDRPLYGNVSVAGRSYAKGTAPTETWNVAAFGPVYPGGSAARTGDRLHYAPARLLSDGAGDWGFDQFATVSVKLWSGSTSYPLSAYDPDVALPKTARTYQLDVAASRDGTLSDRVSVSWSFRSAHAKKAVLPLTTVRFAPLGLDNANSAAAGSVTRIPAKVIANPGAPASPVKSLVLEWSGDDGTTWQPFSGTVTNPAGGYVSLRATVLDQAGDQVVETIRRAYRVRS